MGSHMTDETPPARHRDLLDAVGSSLESVRTARGGVARVRTRLRADETPRFRRPFRLRQGRVIAIVTSLAVAAGAVLAIRQMIADAPLAFRVERGHKAEQGAVGEFISAPSAPNGAEIPLLFSDGTRIGVAPGARLRVAEVESHGARLTLEKGEAHVHVVHRASTRWRIDAGPFAVHVTGTAFDVAWDPAEDALRVKLTNGSVVVTGCDLGDGRRVSAGEQLHVHCRDRVAVDSTGSSTAPLATTASTTTPATASATTPTTASATTPTTASATTPTNAASAIAPSADTAGATATAPSADSTPTTAPAVPPMAPALPPASVSALAPPPAAASTSAAAPGSDPLETLSATDLLALGERARYAGTDRAAVDAFTAIRRRFPGTDAAAAAAFELGRLAADKRGDFAGAVEMFDACVRERPQGNLAREAMGRGLEARELEMDRLKHGDPARAAALASEYLRLHPGGPHAAVARRLLARETR